ncbi:MAG: hypothetical protein ABEH47_08875 [Haloferacaceae archaeon]
MVAVGEALRLAGTALGALGGALLFVEFFQRPSYVEYDPQFDNYEITIGPSEVREHTWAGRIGGFCVALGFALLFVATLVG